MRSRVTSRMGDRIGFLLLLYRWLRNSGSPRGPLSAGRPYFRFSQKGASHPLAWAMLFHPSNDIIYGVALCQSRRRPKFPCTSSSSSKGELCDAAASEHRQADGEGETGQHDVPDGTGRSVIAGQAAKTKTPALLPGFSHSCVLVERRWIRSPCRPCRRPEASRPAGSSSAAQRPSLRW